MLIHDFGKRRRSRSSPDFAHRGIFVVRVSFNYMIQYLRLGFQFFEMWELIVTIRDESRVSIAIIELRTIILVSSTTSMRQ